MGHFTTTLPGYGYLPTGLSGFVRYFIRPERTQDAAQPTAADTSSTTKQHIPYLDGWRGLAILLVLSAHFHGFMYNMGGLGVETFFVLSGLLMSKILFVDKVPLGTFYRNRIARIFPVFYLYIAVITLLTALHTTNLQPSDIAYSAVFLRTYFGDLSIWDHQVIEISHIWSLNVEEHSYLLLSILSLIVMRKNEAAARTLVTVAALLCLPFFGFYKLFPPAMDAEHFYLRTECAGFGILVSASFYLWRRKLQFSIPSYVPLLAMAAGYLIGGNATHGIGKYVLPPLFLAIAVNTLDVAPAWLQRLFSNRVLMWFGVCSYSLYMWQEIFFGMVLEKAPEIRTLGFCAAMAIGTFSYYCFEQPMRKLLRAPTRPR